MTMRSLAARPQETGLSAPEATTETQQPTPNPHAVFRAQPGSGAEGASFMLYMYDREFKVVNGQVELDYEPDENVIRFLGWEGLVRVEE